MAGKSRKALKTKQASTSEANILASKITHPPSGAVDAGKENIDCLSQPKKTKAVTKTEQHAVNPNLSFERELQEMQEKLQQLRIEKEKAEELLKDREDTLRLRDEELSKVQIELKKLQRLKEFKPTMTFPIGESLREEQDKNGIKKKKKKKKKSGAEQKKKPSPPYILWCKDQWNEVKASNPEAEFKEVTNILGAKWKNLTAEEKKPYEEKYQAEKEAYLQIIGMEKRENEAMKLLEVEHKQKTAMELLEQYLQFRQEVEKETTKKAKKEKDPLKPKQPMSAYFLFSNERRADLLKETKNILEVAKLTGEEWKNMTEEQRGPYEEIAKKNKEKYQQEMEAYREKKDEEAQQLKKEEEELMKIQKQEALQLLRKKEKAENIIKKSKEAQQKKKKQKKEEKNADPKKPKKPASSFLQFSKETRKNLIQEKPGINNSIISALISVKWKELKEEERQIWNRKAADAMEAYRKELEEYKKSAEATS